MRRDIRFGRFDLGEWNVPGALQTPGLGLSYGILSGTRGRDHLVAPQDRLKEQQPTMNGRTADNE